MIRNKLNGIHWSGYFPGIIGKITELHAVYYSENWGFDVSFEIQVGTELSEFIKVFLWTFKGLDAARTLYEKTGFKLSEEHTVTQWGQVITEQKYELPLEDI